MPGAGVNPDHVSGRDRGRRTMTTIRFDLPTPEGDTIEFWHGGQGGAPAHPALHGVRGVLLLPPPVLPACWSEAVEWFEASGAGTLYTWSVIYSNDMPPFKDRVPYVAAMVDLAEGPRMATNVVECPFDELRIGMPLRVIFRAISDEFTIPVFVRPERGRATPCPRRPRPCPP